MGENKGDATLFVLRSKHAPELRECKSMGSDSIDCYGKQDGASGCHEGSRITMLRMV
jgi:hypothetical protein